MGLLVPVGALLIIFKIHYRDNLVVEVGFLEILVVPALLHDDLDVDVADVLNFDVLLQEFGEIGHAVDKGEPDVLADHEAVDVGGAAVVEGCLLILVTIVGANHASFGDAEDVTRLPINDVAHVNGAFFGEEDLLNFFELLINYGARLFKPRLKIHEQSNHEVSIRLVLPGVELSVRLPEQEDALKFFQEVTIKVVPVQHVLRLGGQLVEESLLFGVVDGLVAVDGPLVLE